MPAPVYIVCSESGTEDKSGNLLSHFNVIEKILFTRPEGGGELWNGPLGLRFRLVAVWRITEDDDPGAEYETNVTLVMPPDGRERSSDLQTVRVRPNSTLMRIVMRYDGPAPFNGPGLLLVKNRIRRVGTEEWLAQEYPILIDEQEAAPSPEDDDAVSETASD